MARTFYCLPQEIIDVISCGYCAKDHKSVFARHSFICTTRKADLKRITLTLYSHHIFSQISVKKYQIYLSFCLLKRDILFLSSSVSTYQLSAKFCKHTVCNFFINLFFVFQELFLKKIVAIT